MQKREFCKKHLMSVAWRFPAYFCGATGFLVEGCARKRAAKIARSAYFLGAK
jgi:hypothetical protein